MITAVIRNDPWPSDVKLPINDNNSMTAYDTIARRNVNEEPSSLSQE